MIFVDTSFWVALVRICNRRALAFDGDFQAAGFVELRPQPEH